MQKKSWLSILSVFSILAVTLFLLADVDAGTGLVTGVAPGAPISISATDSLSGKTGTATVTLSNPIDITGTWQFTFGSESMYGGINQIGNTLSFPGLGVIGSSCAIIAYGTGAIHGSSLEFALGLNGPLLTDPLFSETLSVTGSLSSDGKSASGTYTVTSVVPGSCRRPPAVGSGTWTGTRTSGTGPAGNLFDPVPDLLDPLSKNSLIKDSSVLATAKKSITGVSADGVTQALIRVSGLNQGDQVTFNLLNDQSGQGAPGPDGALGNPGDITFSLNSLTVNAVSTSQGYMAFAIYRAPVDFVRVGNANDPSVPSRSVTVNVNDATSGGSTSVPITILRPPVLFVHGLWSDSKTWQQFSDALKAVPGLTIDKADYSENYGSSKSVDFNTPIVIQNALDYLRDFKAQKNAAATQFDFIVHSMGGLISNNMPSKTWKYMFNSQETLGQGYIHKLITIDTPYSGSPFAAGLDQSSAACKLIIGLTRYKVDGAIHDMVPGSNFYSTFNPAPSGYYKHAIASSVTEAQSILASTAVDEAVIALTGSPTTGLVLAACYSVFVTPETASPPPPLFLFDLYFGGSNDLIVSTTSQLGPFVPPFADTNTSGVAHFHVALPFLPTLMIPGALDQVSGNPALAIKLLNSPITGGSFKN